jgi:hypothetical protein
MDGPHRFCVSAFLQRRRDGVSVPQGHAQRWTHHSWSSTPVARYMARAQLASGSQVPPARKARSAPSACSTKLRCSLHPGLACFVPRCKQISSQTRTASTAPPRRPPPLSVCEPRRPDSSCFIRGPSDLRLSALYIANIPHAACP